MTQIKLRRDTSANFTSKNPVLGIGEPAYETDTKKLKIGDGTTAYTQLEYFSAGGGGGSTNITATLPLKIVDGVISLEVDGQTIQIVDGKLTANLDDKQDKFETQVPLSISSSSISTSVDTGITETSESWTGGGSDKLVTVNVSALNIDANSDWKIHLSGYMGNYKSTDTNTNALLISAEKNTIFRVWFGSWDFRLGNQIQTFERIPSSNTEFFYEIVHQKNGTEFIFNGTNLVDSSPLPISTMSRALGSGTYTTLAGQGKLKDFSFLINSYQFQRIDRDISKSYFEADGVKYRFTSVEGTNTLNLNIGDGLSVVDGKLTANLDELGNEITDLSGRVTAVEADVVNKASKSDLAAKQDKLSPIAPLGINQTTISNVTDGTFLTDTSVTLNSAFRIHYTTDDVARYLIYAKGASNVGATPTSFIQIPFTLGDLISFPFEKDDDSDIGLVFGYWKEGLFYPTMQYITPTTYGSGSNSYAPFSFVSEAGKSSLEAIRTYYGQSSAVSKSALNFYNSIPLNATNYIQVTKNAGVPTVNMWFTTAGVRWANTGYTQRMYTSDTTVLENFNKTNVCLLLSYDTSKAINLTKVTRRELGDTVLDPTPDALTTALSTYSNSFDATAKVVTNDLSLAIGSGLAITDGKLTASSTAPTNMVTTNTTQTITGAKTFTANTTNFKAVKADGQIDCTTLRVSNPSFYTTNVSTFLGNNGAGVQMYDGTGNYAQFGISPQAKSTYIQPYYNCENLYINNYGDNSDANGVAANVIISGAIKNKVNGTINDVLTSGNVTAYVTEEFVDGTEGYRVWSNGRCEQWGHHVNNHTDITLLKTMKNNTYFVTGIALNYGVLTLKSQTTTSIQIWIGNNPSTEESFYWYLSGELGS